MIDLHGVEFSDEELEVIENIGESHEDYAVCEIFKNRNPDTQVQYDDNSGVITVSDGTTTVKQTVEMLTDVCESQNTKDRIGVGVSMLEVALNLVKREPITPPVM